MTADDAQPVDTPDEPVVETEGDRLARNLALVESLHAALEASRPALVVRPEDEEVVTAALAEAFRRVPGFVVTPRVIVSDFAIEGRVLLVAPVVRASSPYSPWPVVP